MPDDDQIAPRQGSTESDGRRRRSAASRERIITAMLALIQEGERAPSADAVAARAGVGRRTVFRLFNDMEGIFREIHVAMRAKVEPLRDIPITGATLTERLHALAARRVRLLETILPAEEAAQLLRHRSPQMMALHAATQAELRALLEAELPPAMLADQGQVEALDLILSIDCWRRLRRDRGMEPAAALALVQRMLTAQLKDRS
jgi:AcrR family transcriptional regulator